MRNEPKEKTAPPLGGAVLESAKSGARGVRRGFGFGHSLGASLGVHGVALAALVIAVPLGLFTFAGRERTPSSGHVLAVGPVVDEVPPFAEVPPEEPLVPSEVAAIPDPELVDIPWTRFVDRFDVQEELFDDPLGRAPRMELAWTLVQPEEATEVDPEEVPSPDEEASAEGPVQAEANPEEERTAGTRQPVSTPAPSYPRAAIQRGEEGTVVCELYIGATGEVTRVQILASSGFPRLDSAAREALSQWTFEASEDPEPVVFVLRHDVVFQLDEKS